MVSTLFLGLVARSESVHAPDSAMSAPAHVFWLLLSRCHIYKCFGVFP